MNNIKIIYFNAETIDSNALESVLRSDVHFVSKYDIKAGLLVINFRDTSRALYELLEPVVGTNTIFIHDLDSGGDAYWGIMSRNFWDWIRDNRS